MPQAYEVRDAGLEHYNGKYTLQRGAKQGYGFSKPFRNENGKTTMEYDGDGRWLLNEHYAGIRYYYCQSSSKTPPLTGWQVWEGYGKEPAPSLLPADAAQAPAPKSSACAIL